MALALRGLRASTRSIACEEITEGKRLPGVLIERVELHRPADGFACAAQRIGPDVEAEAVFVQVQVGERRAGRRERRPPQNEPFEVIA